MASNRIGRINEEIQRELAELIRSLKDPRTQTMISITHVDTTPDLRYAKVFVSVLEDARSKEALVRACDLGVAMQLTNVARDVGADARLRRMYLPTT